MPWFDMPLEQLREYRTETAEPPEFDAWWQLRLDQARAQARPPALTRYEADIYGPVEVYDAEFSGAGGDRIRGGYLRAARAAETASELSGAPRVAVSGVSQGGGLALACAALIPQVVAVCHADVPFLCDIQRAITLAPDAPYTEVPEFLAHNVDLIPAALDTLRYVDCALLARRITARCLLSVGLMDTICPPSTVFAAYNEIASGKDISVHPFTGHAVPTAHVERQLRHFRDFLLGTAGLLGAGDGRLAGRRLRGANHGAGSDSTLR